MSDKIAVFVCICMIAAAATAVFYLAAHENDKYNGEADIEIGTVRLTKSHDLSKSTYVHGDIIFATNRDVYTYIGGDVNDVYAFADTEYEGIFRHNGPLRLKQPASVGDTVTVVIRAGGNEAAIPVKISIDYSRYDQSAIHIEQMDLALVSSGSNTRIVQADILFSIDKRVPVFVDGGIEATEIRWQNMPHYSEAHVVRHSGLFTLKEPAAPGDEVEILIRHGSNETRIVAEVGGA